MSAKITLYTTYEIPDLRMVQRFGGFYNNDPEQRAVKVAVSASWWSDETTYRDGGVEVSVKGWCQRVKKDGTDTAHAPSDVYDASSWLTTKDWKTITLRLMVDIAALTPPQEILVAFEEALDAHEAKCTYGQEATDGAG